MMHEGMKAKELRVRKRLVVFILGGRVVVWKGVSGSVVLERVTEF
jgi:hypothetical protein